jgi:tetratricopeptide (TPR) repeat protein
MNFVSLLNPINAVRFFISTRYFLIGVVRFRRKQYSLARSYFEKSLNIKTSNNVIFNQYYGQTLLCLGLIDESFSLLSKVYHIYDHNKWIVRTDEELRLIKDTLDALQYINDKFNLKVDNFNHDQNIRIVTR